jgi:hypothetical protein
MKGAVRGDLVFTIPPHLSFLEKKLNSKKMRKIPNLSLSIQTHKYRVIIRSSNVNL